MKHELIQPTDRSTQLLQSLLYNKNPSLEKAKTQIDGFNLQEKISLLKGVLTILSELDSEGKNQDQRDAGLELLRLVDLASLTPQEFRDITKHYIKTVNCVDEDCDPLGEIDALLEAGKIIAPFMPNLYSPHVVEAWLDVALKFREHEKTYILDKSQEIEYCMSSISKRSKHGDFDQQVAEWGQRGLSNKDIAEKLNSTTTNVKNAISRLDKMGITFPRPKGRQLTKERKIIYDMVKERIDKGASNSQIARELYMTVTKVQSIRSVLLRKGK